MKQLKVLELFAGTRSISKEFEKRGHECFTVEFDTQHQNISLYANIFDVTPEMILEQFGQPDIIWASPPCTKFSVASCYRNWEIVDGIYVPKSEDAVEAMNLVKHTIRLIEALQPKYFYIENPRGMLRKMPFMEELNKKRHTVTYCQYGDNRMKPTDIWTSHPNPKFKPICKNGDPCHTAAPRGSRTGTQGLKNAKERSVIPSDLCEHIAKISEQAEA